MKKTKPTRKTVARKIAPKKAVSKTKAVARKKSAKASDLKSVAVTFHTIQELKRKIIRVFNPEKIILFGAYAYGKPNPESDVDLLVVMPNDKPLSQKNAQAASTLFDVPFSLNMLMPTSEEVLKKLMGGDKKMDEVIRRGQVLFERKAKKK